MASVAWHGVEGENENRFIIYLNFWYVDFPLAVTKKKNKKNYFPRLWISSIFWCRIISNY